MKKIIAPLFLLFLFAQCKKSSPDPAILLPLVYTTPASSITTNSAVSGGNITADGGALVIGRGVVYSTTPNPTLANTTVNSGTGGGTFVSNLTGLTAATTYYIRAFATNSKGTAYGNELNFTTQ